MAAAALMLLAAGGALQAYGQYQAGEAENRAAQLNAQVAGQNAALAIQQAAQDERALRVQGRKFLGDMRASYGASGVTMEGSPLEVMKESAAAIELDALNIKYEGETRALGFRNDARLERYRGEYAAAAGRLGAAATLLQTSGNVGSKMSSKPKTTSDGEWDSGMAYKSHTDGKWKRMG